MQTLTLIHPESFPIGKYADALRRESITPLPVARLDQIPPDAGSLRVILVDPAINTTAPSSLDGTHRRRRDRSRRRAGVAQRRQCLRRSAGRSVAGVLSEWRQARVSVSVSEDARHQLEMQLGERTRELRDLSEVGIALSTERDHSVLLTTILSKARELSRADAGSLYLHSPATCHQNRCFGSLKGIKWDGFFGRHLRRARIVLVSNKSVTCDHSLESVGACDGTACACADANARRFGLGLRVPDRARALGSRHPRLAPPDKVQEAKGSRQDRGADADRSESERRDAARVPALRRDRYARRRGRTRVRAGPAWSECRKRSARRCATRADVTGNPVAR